MEECRFFETLETEFEASYVFEHLFFTRDNRPSFDTELKKRIVNVSEGEEEHFPSKRIHKSDDNKVISPRMI